jgi:hypothetical protein
MRRLFSSQLWQETEQVMCHHAVSSLCPLLAGRHGYGQGNMQLNGKSLISVATLNEAYKLSGP